MASWRRKFSRLNVLFICYGTAVEHRSLLNRWGICDGINCCNIFFFMQPFLSIKTAFNLVKIHLLFRIIPLILRATGKISSLLLTVLPSWNKVITYLLTYLLLIQWRVMFCRPCFNRFRGLKYIPRLFSEYMLTFRVEEPMKICVTN